MKVLHVTAIDSTGGGVGRYILSLSRDLKDKNNIDFVITVLKECEFSSFVRSAGFICKILPNEYLTFLGKRFFFYLSIRQLMEVIKHEKIDIVHAHNPHPALLCGIAAFFCGIPSVYTVHGAGRRDVKNHNFGLKFIRSQALKLVENICVFLNGMLVSKIVMVSNPTMNIVGRWMMDKRKIVVVHNGINIHNFEMNGNEDFMKRELSLCGNYIIGSVGRLDIDKGYEYLIESIAQLKSYFSNVKLVLVGNGEEKEKLMRLSERLDISDSIIFAGYYKDVSSVISMFDVFVLPSLCEGFGYCVIEAMAMKKCVVATGVEGILDIITDGENGLLVPPKDSKAIARAILKLLNDHVLRERFELAGYNLVKTKFQLDNFVSKILCIYEELMRKRAKCSIYSKGKT